MHRKLSFLVLLLFASGFCSLVYQVAWIREFRLIFGASTLATSAVLAIFMGGLGVGAAIFGARAERSPNPLKLYALLEIGVTVGAALTPLLLFLVRHLYILTGGSMALGITWATVLRLGLATLVLAAPCILMGGNLPAAVKFIQTNRDQQRRALGVLYGLNAMGAVLGSFLTTFWMLENLGTRESLYAACAVNLVIGLLALTASRKAGAPAEAEASARGVAEPYSSQGIKEALPRFDASADAESTGEPGLAPFVYGAAFLCGFLFFLIELVWYRMLIPLLGGSVFAFGLILTVALFGLACGGILYALTGPGRIASLRAFGLVSALQACAVVMPYALGDRIAIFAYHANGLRSFELTGQIVGWSLTASVIVLMPSIIAGFQFPLLVALLGEGNRGVGRQLGRAYAWNTFGAIAGALSGGFWLIPELSAPGCWLLVAALIALMSGAALVLDVARERGASLGLGMVTPVACIALAVVCCFVTTGPTAAWRHAPIGYGRMGKFPKTVNERKDWVREMNRRMIYDFDGRESSIALVGTTEIAFFVNGKSDGSARTDAGTQVMLGLLPALLHPGPENACVVGLGTGCTAGWLAEVPGIERVDVIELEPGMRRIAGDFGPVNRDVLEKENIRLIDGDAREILVTDGPQYDLIASAPSNPYRAGVASLYTQEYYRAVKARLAEGGLFAQWVQCYEIDTDSMRLLFATLSSVFESVDTWATQPNDFVFVCSNKRPVFSYDEIERKIGTEPFAEAIRRVWFTDSVSGIFDRIVANSEFCRRIASGTPLVNTDNRNLLEFRFARALGKWTRFNPYDVAVEANRQGMRFPPLEGDGLQKLLRRGAAEEGGGGAEVAGGSLEQLLLAERMAKIGRPGTEELVETVSEDWPVEAAVLRAQIAFREKDYEGAARELLSALRHHRDDPWLHQKVMRGALDLAVDLAEAWNAAAGPLFYAIEEPFCVHAIEKERLPALVAVARHMDANHRVRAVDAWGPHFPWSDEFLKFRLACFRETGDARAAEAERDYLLFQESEDSRFALATGLDGGVGSGALGEEKRLPASDGLAKGTVEEK